MESGDEDDVSVSQKDWNRMQEKLHKEGYREGIEKGKEENLQMYFDSTVAATTKHSERIGCLIGLICHALDLGPSAEYGDNLKKLLADISVHMDSIQKDTIKEESSDHQILAFNDRLKSLEDSWEKAYEKFFNEFNLAQVNN